MQREEGRLSERTLRRLPLLLRRLWETPIRRRKRFTEKTGDKKKKESGNSSLVLAGDDTFLVAPSIKIRELENKKKNKTQRKNKPKTQKKKKPKKSDTPQLVGLLPR